MQQNSRSGGMMGLEQEYKLPEQVGGSGTFALPAAGISLLSGTASGRCS